MDGTRHVESPQIPHLRVRFRIVTPMFLGGAEQADAELRISSLKGGLRYWYRAVHPGFTDKMELDRKVPGRKIKGTREELLFGGAGKDGGQSRVVMHLLPGEWKQRPMTPGDPVAALDHLAFFLIPRDGVGRAYLEAGQEFTVLFAMRHRHREDPQDWPGLLAAVWLLVHAGSLGTRGRQGFGTLALEEWDILHAPEARRLLEKLPLPDQADSPREWLEQFRQGSRVIREWLKAKDAPYPASLHTRLDEDSSVWLGPAPCRTWLEALKQGNEILRRFRRQYRNHQILLGLPAWVNGKLIVTADGMKNDGSPAREGRMPSPVRLRIARVGSGYVPQFTVMSAPLPRLGHKRNRRDIAWWDDYTPRDYKEGLRLLMRDLEFRQFLREGWT